MQTTNYTNKLRNIGVIAHVDAGKTTVTEKILFFTGKIHKTVEVHEGGATMDSRETERLHGITISSAATTVHWRDHAINIIDTPGHIDFNMDVRCALRVLDGAIVVFDAVAGVEAQTETNWRLADDFGVARICFVNKLDRAGADFDRVCAEVRERLGVEPLPLQMPMGQEAGFAGVIDLVSRVALSWPDEQGREVESSEIPAEFRVEAERRRQQLLAVVADHCEEAGQAFLNGTDVSAEVMIRAIRAGVLAGAFVPVLCGSALKNKGVQPLLDAVVDLLPSPDDRPVPDGVGESFAALLFKTKAGAAFGALSFCRVYGGMLKPGDRIWNPRVQKRERVNRIFRMHAEEAKAVDVAEAGDIVALTGLKSARTGDTLCAVDAPEILFEDIEIPDPVATVVLEVENRDQREKLALGLDRLVREDPTLRLSTHPETGQQLLSGMGELHLQIQCEELANRHDVDVKIGAPQVAYRETVTESVEVTHRLKKQGGGPGQLAVVTLRVEPLPRGAGVEFESRITGGAISSEFIPAVERGVRDAAQTGVLAGNPVVDFKATLTDGEMHSNDSSTMAFQIAGSKAFQLAVAQASPVVLEPVMQVEVTTPEHHLGDVIGDLSRRRGMIVAQRERGVAKVVEAEVPLAEMFGYIGSLRSITAGRGDYTMELSHYAAVPTQTQARLLAA